MPMTADIAAYLAANIGTWILPDNGTNPAGNVFQDFRPSDPDRCVTLYEQAGRTPKKTFGNTIAWEEPRLHIVSRAAESDGWGVAKSDAREIWKLLNGVSNQTINGVFYMFMEAQGNPQPDELDPNNRPLYVMDFAVMKYMSD